MRYKMIGFWGCVAGGAYLYSILPETKRKERMKPLEQQYIAHRGLFDNSTNRPENSINAFAKAVEEGYGIELDVQLTADKELVVFHDESLLRMCGINKKLRECSYSELKKYKLGNSDESIPLFKDVLDVIDGKVPLIGEVMSDGDWKATTKKMAVLMDNYEGYYCMESFHPFAVKWFRDNRPDVIRGQLSTNYWKDNLNRKWYEKFALTNLLVNCISRPDFIAYNHKWKNNLSYRICRRLFPVENVAWTIKNQEELEEAEKTFDVIMFDSFIPEKIFEGK